MNLWRRRIFGLIGILLGCREILICEMTFGVQLIFLRGIILLVGILERVFLEHGIFVNFTMIG